jgi:hypothetical protein
VSNLNFDPTNPTISNLATTRTSSTLSVTVDQAAGSGYISVYPCDRVTARTSVAGTPPVPGIVTASTSPAAITPVGRDPSPVPSRVSTTRAGVSGA